VSRNRHIDRTLKRQIRKETKFKLHTVTTVSHSETSPKITKLGKSQAAEVKLQGMSMDVPNLTKLNKKGHKKGAEYLFGKTGGAGKNLKALSFLHIT
jgi:hypothetical protein